jgi:hypothetical protein
MVMGSNPTRVRTIIFLSIVNLLDIELLLLLLFINIACNRRLGGPQSQSGQRGEQNILELTVTRTPNPLSSSP